jgi:hypothetical protein
VVFHLALPMLGLWLLLAVPAADVSIEHHPTHFWLVASSPRVNVGARRGRRPAAAAARRPRLLLVGLGFLAAALFLGLHALATPGGAARQPRTAGSRWPHRSGWRWAALFTAASALDFPPSAAQRCRRAARGCARGLHPRRGVGRRLARRPAAAARTRRSPPR